MSTPATTIYICSGVRLNPRYEHSIYFADATAQAAYFAGKVVKTFSAYSYVRKSWPLKVNATMEQAKTWSYLYFRNGSSGKVYYYFITNVEYKNEDTVELTLELDVLQTYMFDFELLQCFVERQHTETDEPGEYILDEGLETGEHVSTGECDYDTIKPLCILVLASINPNNAETEEPTPALAGMYNKVFSGLKLWAVDSSKWAAWGNKLDDLSAAGFLDGIINMWMYPKALVTLGGENTWDDDDLCKTVANAAGGHIAADLTDGFSESTVDGYTPKNKKLLCYPFKFCYVTNNMGASAVYRYEFNGAGYGMPILSVRGSCAPESPVFMWPQNYKGAADNYEEGLTLGNFPTCAWDADIYKMWLAQNQNQHARATQNSVLSIGAGAIAAVGSLAMGNVIGAVGGVGAMVSGAQQIDNLMAQKRDMAIQPPQARGHFSGNVNIAQGIHTFTAYHKSITADHAKTIDGYFTMYGYKLNSVQKPNIAARPAFTYVKTVGCHIKSNMCTDDVCRIESIFDKGITFWKNGDRIGDYSIDNAVHG